MTSKIVEQLKDSFKDAENFTPENLEILIADAIQAFHLIQSKIESPNLKDREEALQIALDLKESLEKQASTLCDAMDMNQEQLDSFVKNPSNFSPEENRAIQQVTQELDQFRKEVGTSVKKAAAPQKKRNTAAAWVHG